MVLLPLLTTYLLQKHAKDIIKLWPEADQKKNWDQIAEPAKTELLQAITHYML